MSPPSGPACRRIRSQAARGSPRQNRARRCHARPGPSAAARAAGTRRSNSASHWSGSAGSRGRCGPARAQNAPGHHRSRPGSDRTRSASVPARASRSRPPSTPAGPAGNRGLCPAPTRARRRPRPPRVPDPRTQVGEHLVAHPDIELLRPEGSHPASFAWRRRQRATAAAAWRGGRQGQHRPSTPRGNDRKQSGPTGRNRQRREPSSSLAQPPTADGSAREFAAQRPDISPSAAAGPSPCAGSGWCPRRSG